MGYMTSMLFDVSSPCFGIITTPASPLSSLQVIAHQGEQVDPELAALERQLLKGHLPGASKDAADLGVPSFEWHIVMEFCDRGSLSRALSSFKLHAPADANKVKWDAWSCLEILKEITR